jgi:hypothetical protein
LRLDEVLCWQTVTLTSVASCGIVDAVHEISSRRIHLQSFDHADNKIISVPMDTVQTRCLMMFRIIVLDYLLQFKSSINAHRKDFSALLQPSENIICALDRYLSSETVLILSSQDSSWPREEEFQKSLR